MRHDALERGGRVLLAASLVLFSHPAWAATIVVDETTCTLVDAITAANNDSPAGGCPAGSGADTVLLTTDVTLTAVNSQGPHPPSGDNGLPVIHTDITIEGDGHVIERQAGAPPFRLLWVEEDGTLLLNRVGVRNGQEASGGAIVNRGSLTLASSTVSDSQSSNGISSGPGVASSAYPTLIVDGSTLSNNSGDAIFFHGGQLVLTNSTLSGNGGKAVYQFVYAIGPVTLSHCTLLGNASGIAAAANIPDMTVTGTLVADSSDANCQYSGNIDGANSFADDDSCGSGFAPIVAGADVDTTLADNGGPTRTHALLPGSVAIDAAGTCGLATDQRGVARDDGACDSGAFELASAIPMSSPGTLAALGAGLLAAVAALVVLRLRRPGS